jgi:segregation and condensation protein A
VTSYTVQLSIYQGPFDLLLELIERAELDITKVSLAKVADQYMQHLKTLAERNLEDLASFLVIAARLLQIKSEALLPRPPMREPGEEDPGDALARQLIEYKKYKQIALHLAEREGSGLRTYVRIAPVTLPEPQLDMRGIELQDLRQALLDALATIPQVPDLNDVVAPHRVTIREQIQIIVANLHKKGHTTFQSLIGLARSRLEIAVSFLALLELVKQHQVVASQQALFGDIEISPGERWDQSQEAGFELEFE